jgi:hypothetical protein
MAGSRVARYIKDSAFLDLLALKNTRDEGEADVF